MVLVVGGGETSAVSTVDSISLRQSAAGESEEEKGRGEDASVSNCIREKQQAEMPPVQWRWQSGHGNELVKNGDVVK